MATAGKSTVIKIGANAVQGLNSGNLTLNGELMDVTTFASGGWIEKQQGLKSAEVGLEGFWMTTDTNGQTALTTAYTNGTTVSLSTLFDGTAGWSGSFHVASLEISSEVSGTVGFSCSLESTGALTKV